MAELEIRRTETGFCIGEDAAAPLAEIEAVLEDGRLVITHTFVGDALRGQGVARRLVDAVVARARAEGRTIVPECEYAKNVLERDPQYADVLDAAAGTEGRETPHG